MKKFFCMVMMVTISGVLMALELATDSVANVVGCKDAAADSLVVKELQLEGVAVKAARVVKTVDGIRMFPSQQQLETSPDGYSLMRKLALPGVKVDEAMRTVTAPDMIGSVQVRINDVPASMQDMLSLDMALVQSVDFITSPGLRYGDGVAYVIDIHVLRPKSGYVVGGEVLQSIGRRRNADNVYFRLNRGKSAFSFGYDFGWTDFRGFRIDNTVDYHLPDGLTTTVQNRFLSYKSPQIDNGFSAQYSFAEDEKYFLLATLSRNFSNSPSCCVQKEVLKPLSTDTVTIQNKDRASTTQIDLYFNLHLPHAQTLTANVVGTYVGSRYAYASDAVSPYAYHVRGNTCCFTSEWLYENRFRPFTLAVGFQLHQQYIGNKYIGDLQKDNPLHQSGQYLYAQLQGKLFGVGYRAGMGMSHVYYSQQGCSFSYWLPRPKVMLHYAVSSSFSLRYDFDMRSSAPRIAQLIDVSQVDNRVQLPNTLIETLTVGNPCLKASPDYEHQLSLDYRSRHIVDNFTFFYRNCHRTRMQDIDRQVLPDGTTQYILTRTNQGSVQMLYLINNLTLFLLPDVLELNFGTSFLRCFNFGDRYTHLRNTLMGSADLHAYLGRFTLSAGYDSGWRFLEGESKGDGGVSASLSASYRLSKLGSLSLFWQHPFDRNVCQSRGELLNRYLHSVSTYHSTDLGNMILLRLSFNLSHGRRYATEQKTLQNTHVDTGVVRHE